MLDHAGLLDEDGRPNAAAIREVFKDIPQVQDAVGNCRNMAMGADKRKLAGYV